MVREENFESLENRKRQEVDHEKAIHHRGDVAGKHRIG